MKMRLILFRARADGAINLAQDDDHPSPPPSGDLGAAGSLAMRWFAISLHDPAGVGEAIGSAEFSSMSAARDDALAAAAEMGADLLRMGKNPFGYFFHIVDNDDGSTCDVPLSGLLNG